MEFCITQYWESLQQTFPMMPVIDQLPVEKRHPALNPADNDQFTQMSFFHRQFVNRH